MLNRVVSVAAILTAAGLVRLARTMRDRLEQESMRARAADRLKSQILANLSHELRTPLNAIIGFTELLLADCRPDQRNSLDHLQSSSRRLLLTIENLLDLSHARDQVLRAETLDLAAILSQAIEAARTAAERRITLLNGVAADTPQVIGDAWAMRRIADNLIGNAVKFTAPGGSVRVATETTDGSVSPWWRIPEAACRPRCWDSLASRSSRPAAARIGRMRVWAPAWPCAAGWRMAWARGWSSPASRAMARR